MPRDRTDSILDARASVHGDFRNVAYIAQALKTIMRHGPNWDHLTDVQREALDMDATKTARIVCGDAGHADHWDDKAGYARLVEYARAADEAEKPGGDAP